MNNAIGSLEKNVVAAAALIANLRETVERLTRELERSASDRASRDQAPRPAPEPPDQSLLDELERLRAERIVMRDSIRRLIKEIDRVSW